MKKFSLRLRLVMTTMAAAASMAVVVVIALHIRSREQGLAQLDESLDRKCSEVVAVLAAPIGTLGVETFLEVETSYRDSPHEYRYQVLDASGEVLVASPNTIAVPLAAPNAIAAGADRGGAVHTTIPTPSEPGELLRLRIEHLPDSVRLGGRGPIHVAVAVNLKPLDEAVRSGLWTSYAYATVGLLLLFVFVWFTVGRSLRRVAHITDAAASITYNHLRERLPLDGSGDELDRLSLVLNAMLDGLHRSMDQMEAFTSDAAHQLRTPLTRMRAELDLVIGSSYALDPPRAERLERLRDELEQLSHTCSRLLLLARLDQGALAREIASDRVDLGDLVRGLADQLGPLAAEREITIRCDDAGPVECVCSRPLLSEAILNLLHNAVRYSPRAGCIDVGVRVEGETLVVEVCDQGPGVSDAQCELVFRRFFRGTPASEHADQGIGLGLSIVRGIAQAHGGFARVVPGPPPGARFRLELPRRFAA